MPACGPAIDVAPYDAGPYACGYIVRRIMGRPCENGNATCTVERGCDDPVTPMGYDVPGLQRYRRLVAYLGIRVLCLYNFVLVDHR